MNTSIDDTHPFDRYIKFLGNQKYVILSAITMSILGVFISLVLGDWTWFSRIGSLITISGLLLISSPIFDQGIYISQARSFGYGDIGSDERVKITNAESKKIGDKVFVGIIVTLIGTVIWGFGDLINYLFSSSPSEFMLEIPFGSIFANAAGGFLGGLALLWSTLGFSGVRNLRGKLGRPSVRIDRRKTPENIFSGLELGAPAIWVQEQLGKPSRVGKKWWGYIFSDSLVSLRFDSNYSLRSIAVGLIDTETTFEFPSWHFDCPPLGKMKLRDLLGIEHLDLRFQDSLRHRELLVTGREGPRGNWHYIAFGALDPDIPGPLYGSDFEWNKEKGELITDPDSVLINWAAVSIDGQIDHFPWDFGVTI